MSFDRAALIEACRTHGIVARVVVARVRGSAPREVGAAMLVWQDGMSGTIGGGALEHAAMQAARALSGPGACGLTRHALGPDLGQCCGGSVDLWTEAFDAARAEALPTDLVLSGQGDMPLAVARARARMRAGGLPPAPQLLSGWMIEPVTEPARDIWVWGAGHVGRALVAVLAPLPGLRLTWIDVEAGRFPPEVFPNVNVVAARQPEQLVRFAPARAEHLIVTFSHDLDLAICNALLAQGFGSAGLIGSATKWARFRKRLAALGHPREKIDRIACPIGDPSLGKHPQAIAIGVSLALMRDGKRRETVEETA